MIHYKGKTFCIANCANEECPDNLTREVEDQAEAGGLSISCHDRSGDCEDFLPIKYLPEDYEIQR